MTTSLQKIRQGAIALTLIFCAAVCAYRWIGSYTWLEAIWMVVITISTVGFSERTDSTPEIQITTMMLIVFGVTAAAYTCGGFIQLALEGEIEKAFGKRKMNAEISKLQNHVVICGFGRLGDDLAKQLQHRNQKFVVIDQDPVRVSQCHDDGILAILGDATDEAVLQEAQIVRAKSVVSALPSDAENVFIALTARNLSPPIQIIAKAELESSCKKLRQAGADKIVMPHRVGAQQMERMISRPTTADMVELFAEATHLDMDLDEFLIGQNSDLVGKSISQSKLKEEFNLLVIGLKNGDGQFNFNPKPHQIISANDIMLVIGDVNDINQMKAAHA